MDLRQYYLMGNLVVRDDGKILRGPNGGSGDRIIGLKLSQGGMLIPWRKIREEVDSHGVKKGIPVIRENGEVKQWPAGEPVLSTPFPILNVAHAKGRWLLGGKRLPAGLVREVLGFIERTEEFFKWLRCFDWIDGPFAEVELVGKGAALVFFRTMARLYLFYGEGRSWSARQVGNVVRSVRSVIADGGSFYVIVTERAECQLNKVAGYEVGAGGVKALNGRLVRALMLLADGG